MNTDRGKLRAKKMEKWERSKRAETGALPGAAVMDGGTRTGGDEARASQGWTNPESERHVRRED